MTVPKSRETSAVYIQQTGDESSIYAARQVMRACNNNNMRYPINIRDTHVINLLLHALIPCLAAYNYKAIMENIYSTFLNTNKPAAILTRVFLK